MWVYAVRTRVTHSFSLQYNYSSLFFLRPLVKEVGVVVDLYEGSTSYLRTNWLLYSWKTLESVPLYVGQRLALAYSVTPDCIGGKVQRLFSSLNQSHDCAFDVHLNLEKVMSSRALTLKFRLKSKLNCEVLSW